MTDKQRITQLEQEVQDLKNRILELEKKATNHYHTLSYNKVNASGSWVGYGADATSKPLS